MVSSATSLQSAERNRLRELVGNAVLGRQLPATRTSLDKAEGEQQLREVALAAGVPAADLSRNRGYGRIVREAGALMQPGGSFSDLAVSVWMSCSVLLHGSLYGALDLLDLEIVETVDGVATGRVSTSMCLLCLCVDVAVTMTDRGLQLYQMRARR